MSTHNATPPVVIVGTGHAGTTLAREFRKLDADTPLVLITADDGKLYYKPNLSKALADGKTPDDLVMQEPDAAAEQYGAELIRGERVTAIDPSNNTLNLGDTSVRYRDLVLAIGASQRDCPLEGDAQRVLTVNDLGDYREFREQLDADASVAILGAGLIGCEFANDLAAQVHTVHVVDPQPHPLPRLLPPEQGAALADALEALGVQWHFGTVAKSIGVDTVTLESGKTVKADVVLSAIGLVPNTNLAAAAGLKTGAGIQVNAQLQTSAAHIYALGDCAELPGGLVLPYVVPATHAARALAKTLAGTATALKLPAVPVMVKTPALPTIVCPPPQGAAGAWAITGELPDFVATFDGADGQKLGFALTGAATKQRGALAREMPPLLSD